MLKESPPPEIECTPMRWRVLDEYYPAYGRVAGGIYIEVMGQRDGKMAYAVRLRNSFDLSKSGEWHYTPIPSSRTATYLKRHRWDDFEAALKAAKKAAARVLKESPQALEVAS